MEFTKETCSPWKHDIEEALKLVAQKYGCSIHMGGVRYSNDSLEVKLTFNKTNNANKVGVVDNTAIFTSALKKVGFQYDTGIEDLGIVNLDNNYRFVGIATSRSKFPYAFQKPDKSITLYTYEGFEQIRKKYRAMIENKSKIETL